MFITEPQKAVELFNNTRAQFLKVSRKNDRERVI